MDARVWSAMPDDILWLLLRHLPFRKQVQLHLVCRKWRQLLTSAHFHNACAAAAAAAAPSARSEEELRLLACVTKPLAPMSSPSRRRGQPRWAQPADNDDSSSNNNNNSDSSSLSNAEVVDATECFRRSDAPGPRRPPAPPYYVQAVGDGLVCIANC